MARKFSKQQAQEWLEEMRRDLRPGDTITTVLRGRAASGMSRHIDVYRLYVEDGKVKRDWLSPRVAAVCGFTFDEKRECLRVSGCGMDMGHHVVYSLGRKLWPDGFGMVGECVDEKALYAPYRPDSEEHAAQMVANGWSFRGRNGDTSGWDNDGGFALRQEWL